VRWALEGCGLFRTIRGRSPSGPKPVACTSAGFTTRRSGGTGCQSWPAVLG